MSALHSSTGAMLLGFCSLMVTGAAGAQPVTPQLQILAIEQAMAASQTAAGVLKYFDPNVVFDDMTPGQVSGLKAVSADITGQFANVKSFTDKILKISVAADDHLAFAYSIQKVTVPGATPAQDYVVTFRQIDGYHQVGGKWLLVYQNLSLPYDPKTLKAVFNEAP